MPVAAALGVLMASGPAHADEPWLLSAEAGYLQPLTRPQRDLFQPGGSASVGLYRPVASWFLVGVRLRGALLADGASPRDTGRVDPGMGTLVTGLAALRIRPFPVGDDPRRGVGPWIEGAGGGGLTGDLGRGTFEIGIGWGFAAGSVDIGPSVRYIQVIDTRNDLDSRDAKMLLAGLEVTLFDARPAAAEPRKRKPRDRDGDGLPDPVDECPTEPEDYDDFEDEDGCPDPDNDGDGVLDENDACPLQPEGPPDGWKDGDGCPDPDNDADGIPDDEDACPDEAEVVNGVEDEDGCPDEGVIELVGDRVVLEEHVMFDKDNAKLKRSARPVLEAIVELWEQHPEWAKLRIEGHADIRGPERWNRELSKRRAHVTMRKLVDLGIPRDIITYKGFGSSEPRDLRRTHEAHRRNRRVEFVVVDRQSDAEEDAQTPPGSGASPQDDSTVSAEDVTKKTEGAS